MTPWQEFPRQDVTSPAARSLDLPDLPDKIWIHILGFATHVHGYNYLDVDDALVDLSKKFNINSTRMSILLVNKRFHVRTSEVVVGHTLPINAVFPALTEARSWIPLCHSAHHKRPSCRRTRRQSRIFGTASVIRPRSLRSRRSLPSSRLVHTCSSHQFGTPQRSHTSPARVGQARTPWQSITVAMGNADTLTRH